MARTEELWQIGTGDTHIETIDPNGFDILVRGLYRYINFNAISGSSGYGFRDNNGTLEFKNDLGVWAAIGSGGGTPGGSDTQVQFNDGGAFGGDAAFLFDKTTSTLKVPNLNAGVGNNLSVVADGNIVFDAIGGGVLLRGNGNNGVSSNNGSTFAYFDNTGQTADRTFLFPDQDGTFALTSDITGNTFESVSKNLKAYNYVVTYTGGGDIDYITYDLGSGLSIVKTFSYSSGNVSTVVLSADIPPGISTTKTFSYDSGGNVSYIAYS